MNDLRNFADFAPAMDSTDAGPPLTLTFTGTGAEYCRIWLVNLTLTLCTLGAYGAWAKVRRTQYFYRNTQLAGVCFDYTALPQGILLGRILALLLLSGYTLAYSYSPEAGGIATIALALLLPSLLWQSQRFRARNSLHRGLRFGFHVSLKQAYVAYLPPIVFLFTPAVIAALTLERRGGAYTLTLTALGFALLPLFHASFRSFVQSHTAFGQARFGFTASPRTFFGVWLKGIALVLWAGLLSYVLMRGLTVHFAGMVAAKPWLFGLFMLLAALYGYLAFLMIGAYYTARFQDMVWSATHVNERLSFQSRVSALSLLKIRAINWLCIVCTLGFYRPFAVIRELRYRVQCVQVHGFPEARTIDAAALQSRRGATGESAAQLFDLDVGI